MENKLFPAFLKLEGKRVLVVGGGEVSLQKLHVLLPSGPIVTVVAPEVSSSIRALTHRYPLQIEQRWFRSDDVVGHVIVFAATDDPTTQNEVERACHDAGVLVNVVDVPDRCDFYTGSTVTAGPFKLAISTNGKAPAFARAVRRDLEARTEGLGDVVVELGRYRADLREIFPRDYRRRCAEFERLFSRHGERDILEPRRYREFSSAIRSARSGLVRHSSAVPGTVLFVGAGPGDPELITRKGLAALREGEVILYDRLVNPILLEEARLDAELVDVGKSPGRHGFTQEAINARLIRSARGHRIVVRLKGGDGGVFGRLGEEIAALKSEEIPYRIIPGITAAAGAAASVGYSLTKRGVAGSVTFITATRRDGGADVPAHALVESDGSLAVYMGLSKFGEIRRQLLDAGMSPDTPVIAVERATQGGEQVVEGTLADIYRKIRNVELKYPVMFLIGQAFAQRPGARCSEHEERTQTVVGR